MRKPSVRAFFRAEDAAINMEYAIVLAGIAIVLLVVVATFGGAVKRSLDGSSTAVAAAMSGDGSSQPMGNGPGSGSSGSGGPPAPGSGPAASAAPTSGATGQ
jgi:Flp pilus assembly pilin Flp